MLKDADFLEAAKTWLQSEPRLVAAVHFGSSATSPNRPTAGPPDRPSADLDLHTITTDATGMEHVDWAAALPNSGFILQVVRPATGGVRKVTALFESGELDLVLVPEDRARQVRSAMAAGEHQHEGPLRGALNELATCLVTGYKILKGEAEWGSFYRQALADLPGVRLSDAEARVLADTFLCDLAWIHQKLARGELRAAQHLLHTSLAATNFRLLRELRQRRGDPMPSFGLARRAEQLVLPTELAWITVDARLDKSSLATAAQSLLIGLESLLAALAPSWSVPQSYPRHP